MISNQVIKKTIEDLKAIVKIDFAVFEPSGAVIAATWETENELPDLVRGFALSPAESQAVRGYHYFKAGQEEEVSLILVVKGNSEEAYTMGRVALCQLQSLMTAYREKLDRSSFIQNLILDNMLTVDIYNKAKKLRISAQARRLVYIVESKNETDGTIMEIMKGLFGGSSRDFLTEVDEKSLILVQELEENQGYETAEETAETICGMLNTEAMIDVRVAYGTICEEITQVSHSYKEARMALDVGKIFYSERHIHAYKTLGIGRLIYQLPVNLCEMFMNEVFTLQKPSEFDEETLTTISKFFENNLNVSETARQLFVHRNTLVYRLEKLQKSTGLDIRSFEDALTFKIALMVASYMNHMKDER